MSSSTLSSTPSTTSYQVQPVEEPTDLTLQVVGHLTDRVLDLIQRVNRLEGECKIEQNNSATLQQSLHNEIKRRRKLNCCVCQQASDHNEMAQSIMQLQGLVNDLYHKVFSNNQEIEPRTFNRSNSI